MALVRKRGRVGQWLGCGQKRLVGSHLPSESQRGNGKKQSLTDSGEGGEDGERKVKTDTILSYIRGYQPETKITLARVIVRQIWKGAAIHD